MNAVQEAAHRALNLPLWQEWEAYCARIKTTNPTAQDQRNTPMGSSKQWIDAVQCYYGSKGAWMGDHYENFLACEDLYTWIP